MATPLSMRARGAVAALLEQVPAGRARALAVPPRGSGLAPVLGDPGVPLVGHSLGFLQSSLEISKRMYERFGPIFWLNAFGTEVVMVLGPDALETVFTNRDRAFSSQGGWDYFIGPFFERGVMLMDFEEHRHHRRILQQAFTRERLVAYLAKMHPAIERGVVSLVGDGATAHVELYPALKQITLDVATEVFVGAQVGREQDRLNRAFIDTVVGGQAFLRADLPIPGAKWHQGLASRRLLQRYFASQIPAKRAGDGDDLFSVLCHARTEEGDSFTDTDVVNHMIFTMMAAHDTSTITATMMAYELAAHPDWQARVRDELDALDKPRIGFDDLERLALTDLVFRETLRINAPVGVVARRARVDTELEGHFIPAGARLLLGVYPTHRMEPWWSAPDRFDPERFSPERAEDRSHRYAWCPFGGNVHKCIGLHFGSMEVKALIHALLTRYELSVPEGYAPPIDYGTGPFPADGLPITLTRR